MRLIVLAILLIFISCSSVEEKISYKEINYIGRENGNRAIIYIDQVLKKNGNLGSFGDLSVGLNSLVKRMKISIIDKEDLYIIEMISNSTMGDDYSFTIDKKTGVISDISIGSIDLIEDKL